MLTSYKYQSCRVKLKIVCFVCLYFCHICIGASIICDFFIQLIYTCSMSFLYGSSQFIHGRVYWCDHFNWLHRVVHWWWCTITCNVQILPSHSWPFIVTLTIPQDASRKWWSTTGRWTLTHIPHRLYRNLRSVSKTLFSSFEVYISLCVLVTN